MKKITDVTMTVKREEYYCDVCGNRIDSLDMKFCDVCGKHLCVQCTVRSEDVFNEESPSYYCRSCWNIGDIYRDDINAAREECVKKIAILENRWRKSVKVVM